MKDILFLVFISFAFAQIPCNFTSKDGIFYDFSPLRNDQQDYYIPKNTYPYQGWDLWINLCRPLVNPLCGASSGVCQQWDPTNPAGHASMGVATTLTFSQESGFIAGSEIDGVDGRETEIRLFCNSSQDIGKIVYVQESPQHHYIFKWANKYACSTCINGNDCTSCTSNGTCKWCLDTNQCVGIGNNGCKSYISNPSFCPASCNQIKSCENCTDNGCAWCLDDKKCMSNRDFNCKDRVEKKSFCHLKENKLRFN